MVMTGETVASILGGTPPNTYKCFCGSDMALSVHKTCAFYIGYVCDKCGPFSRESGYYKAKEEADDALGSGDIGQWRIR